MTERGAVLDEAKAVINGERQNQYGNPEDSFRLIAAFWSSYLGIAVSPPAGGGDDGSVQDCPPADRQRQAGQFCGHVRLCRAGR